jgi:hypothetical protein
VEKINAYMNKYAYKYTYISVSVIFLLIGKFGSLCGGNHPVNYKGCTVYKDLQKKTQPPLHLEQYTPPAQIKQTLYTQPGVTYAQITKQNSYAPINVEQ